MSSSTNHDSAAASIEGNPPSSTAGRRSGKSKKKSRSQLNRELDEQARERKRDQEYKNIQNPPKDGEIYICAFCEFESINGYKPMNLIRAFEMKERKKRLEAERRQRLLEKAKARNRKAKKGKLPARTTPTTDNQAPVDNQVPLTNPDPSDETHSEVYEDDEDYGDAGDGYGPDYSQEQEVDIPPIQQVGVDKGVGTNMDPERSGAGGGGHGVHQPTIITAAGKAHKGSS